jgi:DNA-binding helix-hairpin-helix protein with protein kinase domain
MAPVFYSQSRTRVVLGRELARGGEGAIFTVEGTREVVAKIYHPAPPPGYEGKLAWMLVNPPTDPAVSIGFRSIAWSAELLYGEHRDLAGFLMPRINDAVPLFDVFNRRRRQQVLPDFNWRYLHQTARNLAASLAAIHERGYVVGDLNESNVLVTPRALVAAVDTDSFQVQATDRLYPCGVGKPEYTPPELQGQPFAGIARTPEHDAFALAVLIFQLLKEGNHPYRARWLGSGDPPPLESRISSGSFPYHALTAGNDRVAPPPSAPAWETLHPAVALLMTRCFIDGHDAPHLRPKPQEWRDTIDLAIGSLISCDHGHYFVRGARSCPWCLFVARTAPRRMPVITHPTKRAHARSSTAASLPTPQKPPRRRGKGRRQRAQQQKKKPQQTQRGQSPKRTSVHPAIPHSRPATMLEMYVEILKIMAWMILALIIIAIFIRLFAILPSSGS